MGLLGWYGGADTDAAVSVSEEDVSEGGCGGGGGVGPVAKAALWRARQLAYTRFVAFLRKARPGILGRSMARGRGNAGGRVRRRDGEIEAADYGHRGGNWVVCVGARIAPMTRGEQEGRKKARMVVCRVP